MYRVIVSVLFASMVTLSSGQTTLDQCGFCDVEACAPMGICAAGITLDPCGCCFVCGRVEGEKCDNYTLPLAQKNQYGFCGESMACLLRTDTSSTVIAISVEFILEMIVCRLVILFRFRNAMTASDLKFISICCWFAS